VTRFRLVTVDELHSQILTGRIQFFESCGEHHNHIRVLIKCKNLVLNTDIPKKVPTRLRSTLLTFHGDDARKKRPTQRPSPNFCSQPKSCMSQGQIFLSIIKSFGVFWDSFVAKVSRCHALHDCLPRLPSTFARVFDCYLEYGCFLVTS